MRPASLIICSSNRPQLLAETLPGGNWMPTAITSRSSGDRKTTRFKEQLHERERAAGRSRDRDDSRGWTR